MFSSGAAGAGCSGRRGYYGELIMKNQSRWLLCCIDASARRVKCLIFCLKLLIRNLYPLATFKAPRIPLSGDLLQDHVTRLSAIVHPDIANPLPFGWEEEYRNGTYKFPHMYLSCREHTHKDFINKGLRRS